MALDHVSVGSNDIARARAFYMRALAPLGLGIVAEQPGKFADFGECKVEFSIESPTNGERATVGNGVHVCFAATSREQVDAFHAAAMTAGGIDDGAPGPRPEYGRHYYGAFVRDPDGHKIEACCHLPA